MTQPYIIITQTHDHWAKHISKEEIEAALPEQASLWLDPLPLHRSERVEGVHQLPWREAQLAQAVWFERQKPLLTDTLRRSQIGYLGATYIPLAMDLGFRLKSFQKPVVFQQHHETKRYGWRQEPKDWSPPTVCVDGLPTEETTAKGDVLIRISASYPIAPEATRRVLPHPVSEVDIRLDPIRLDPFNTVEQLEACVEVFKRVLEGVNTCVPNATKLHIILAGPLGLALRIGGSINPTIYPPVQTWQYDRSLYDLYRPAFVLGRTIKELEMPLNILFLATDRRHNLRQDTEHREITQRLIEGGRRDRFRLVTHLDVEARELQALLDRESPTILHFSGHGDGSGHMLLADGRGKGHHALSPAVLANTLSLYRGAGGPRLAVLNACHSSKLMEELMARSAIDFAIGMSDAIADDVAVGFAAELYRAISDGRTLQEAFDRAVNQATRLERVHKAPDPSLFQLRALPGLDPSKVRLHE